MQLSAISLAITRIGRAGFSPADLFASGEQGVWYDPSDLTTMFQDRAGTTPVTADGQTVGKILDKSGRGNHAVAPSDAARPLYKTDGTYHWLQFDGVDDYLSTANIDFTSTDKMSVFSGSNGHNAICSSSPISSGFAVLRAQANNGFRGDLKDAAKPYCSLAVDVKKIITVLFDSSQSTILSQVRARSNGADLTLTTNGSVASGNQGTYPVVIGDWAAAYKFVGNIYSLIVRGALSTADEITATEMWVNQRTGAY